MSKEELQKYGNKKILHFMPSIIGGLLTGIIMVLAMVKLLLLFKQQVLPN